LKPLPHEIELQKVLDAIKDVAPHFKVPPIYMFQFMERGDIYGNACNTEEINLSMRTIGDFNCNNEQFVATVVHEVVHLNCWENGHDDVFKSMNSLMFIKVWRKLNEAQQPIQETSGTK
jgi:hypothetical protein